MEPYYKQCNGADEAYAVMRKWELRQPYIHKTLVGASCKICGKEFTHSRKGRLMGANQQDTALTNHLITEHQISDHKERRQYKNKASVVHKRYETYQEYLDNLTTSTVEK